MADAPAKKVRTEGGRYGFSDYPRAPITHMQLEGYAIGQVCPCCNAGKLYRGEARKVVSFKGSAPIEVERYQHETLRCNSCLKEYTAPRKVQKWQASARSSLVLQRLHGMPFYRLAKLQGLHDVPLAATTMWEQGFALWQEVGIHIYSQLCSVGANCNMLQVDDTGAKVLEVISTNKRLASGEKGRACHTTVISGFTEESQKLVIYMTANKHSGEHLDALLQERNEEKREHYLKLMGDASSSNLAGMDSARADKILQGSCLAHGRQKFVDVKDNWPQECAYFLGEIKAIYTNEAHCQDAGYHERKRYKYHRLHSRKHFKHIYAKIRELYTNKVVEPNSDLGKSMNYWLNNRDNLGRFLRVKGIPLDNNAAERALKDIILQRKNSLFFKTLNSAEVWSGLASIVKTCSENLVNAFEYLNWLQKHWLDVQKQPANYLPWHYKEYLNNTELIAA